MESSDYLGRVLLCLEVHVVIKGFGSISLENAKLQGDALFTKMFRFKFGKDVFLTILYALQAYEVAGLTPT